jgi:ABC-2 type transport system ATP-binding protein
MVGARPVLFPGCVFQARGVFVTAPLVAEGLFKRFGPVEAVRGVSLEVRPGEVFGLLGQNGAGKSTLLRLLSGLVVPDQGTVRLCGHDVRRERVAALSCAGFLVEGPTLPAELTARAALRWAGLLGGGVDESRLDAVLAQVGLSGAGHKRVRELSLGMKQRLGIGAALLREPKLLVLDEPMNGLDPGGIRELSELLAGLARGGTAVLVSSHLLDEVERVANRAAVMADGKVAAVIDVSAQGKGALAERFFELTRGAAA